MFPDWPKSNEDMVPLPRCDGPKLMPFDFQGAQKIEFLEYVGEGFHAHVFKVRILGQIYAIKLFRFVFDTDWMCGNPYNTDWIMSNQEMEDHPQGREVMSAFYDYAEPFSCECRAFGRLQEAGHEELGVECFGYILLDEEHELTLQSRFPDVDFDGNIDCSGGGNLRKRFLGQDDRVPPIRGIIKEFITPNQEDELKPEEFSRLFDDISFLQQLGIFNIDVAARQLVGGKLSDFSTAITVPHFLTTPELNPQLTQKMRNAMERETFRRAKDDYIDFNEMMHDWNIEHGEEKGTIALRAFPEGLPILQRYYLRNRVARKRTYTFVDPRRYNWKWRSAGTRKCRRRVVKKPPLWIVDCSTGINRFAGLTESTPSGGRLEFGYKDGLIFPFI